MSELYRIASLIVDMETYGLTETFSRPYSVGGNRNVDIIVRANHEEMKTRYPHYNEETLEYMGTASSFYKQLLNYGGIMIHSSAIVMNGNAYLFSARKGTGKSTHTCLWRRVFGDELVRIINDDKPAVRYESGKWYAYGTPWSGKTGQNLNLRVPIAGICFLERGEENVIKRCSTQKAIYNLLDQTGRPHEYEARKKTLQIIERIIDDIPIWEMKCNLHPEAAIVSYEAMSGEKWTGEEK